jgi:glycosyltransferase involved in cell wall biosynthesis
MGRMKILIIASDFPWPRVQGGHLRLTTAIEALASLGETDLFAVYDYRRSAPTLPPSVPVDRLLTVERRGSPHQLRWRAAWLARRGIPLEVAMQRMDASPRLQFERWVAEEYDVVWFDRAAMFDWLGRPHLGPTIVDLHDLEDEKGQSRVRIIRSERQREEGVASLRRPIAMAQARLNARDWRQFQRSVAGDVDRVVLCSDLDVRRSGLPNAVVVPNAYERPDRAVGHITVGEPPVVLFQATFDYAPNMDAVEWLVAEVAPMLRARVPDVEIRLVGKPVPGVERLHRPPAVTVVGVVPTMEPELARADIAVVPIRYGSGTRLKILESFAHRVPVVSTSIGAEGLRVEDGVHLLLADNPDAFAAACERLLTEPDLRKRLVDAAEERYLACYERSTARDHIQALVREVAGDAPPQWRPRSGG